MYTKNIANLTHLLLSHILSINVAHKILIVPSFVSFQETEIFLAFKAIFRRFKHLSDERKNIDSWHKNYIT